MPYFEYFLAESQIDSGAGKTAIPLLESALLLNNRLYDKFFVFYVRRHPSANEGPYDATRQAVPRTPSDDH